MDRCALFVDAGYLLADGAMAVHGTRHRDTVSWDFGGLLQLLGNLARERTGLPLLRCYWYEATVEGRRSLEHEALADLPGLKLRIGRIRPGRREGVDAEIHRDLMTLARNGALADAVLVSGDEDLTQVIVDAQDFGVRVTVVHVAADGNWTISRSLRQECDELIEVAAGQLRPYVNLLAGIEAPASGTAGALGPGSSPATSSSAPPASPLSNGHGTTGSLGPLQTTGPHSSPPPSSPLTGPPPAAPSPLSAPSGSGTDPVPPTPSSSSTVDFPRPTGAGFGSPSPSGAGTGYDNGHIGSRYDSASSGAGYDDGATGPRYDNSRYESASYNNAPYDNSRYDSGSTGSGYGSQSTTGGGGYDTSGPGPGSGYGPPTTGTGSFSPAPDHGMGNGSAPHLPSPGPGSAMGNGSSGPGMGSGGGTGSGGPTGPHPRPNHQSPPSGPMNTAPTPAATAPPQQPGTGPQYLPPLPSSQPPPSPPSFSKPPSAPPPAPPSPGPYTGPQQIAPVPAQQAAPTLADAVKAAHQEGQDFGESVARDAPALWLEAVLARKPRMPSDLEARLLQGSALPIDFLLHDEVRHALRRGFWDALERSRR